MLIWSIFALMTGAAVFALLWPLGGGRVMPFAETADATELYRAQLGEIECDQKRGLIAEAEAAAARNEAARRLLKAAGDDPAPTGETEPSLRRRRAASAIALSCVPLIALVVYGAYGSPNEPDRPLSARLQSERPEQDFARALARIESHLAQNPKDGRGWAVLAPVYMRQSRFDDAARAFAAAVENGEASADHFAVLGEARMLAAGGGVTAAAREALSAALTHEAGNPRARFFLAIAKEQDGNMAGAVADLRALLADAPPGATWTSAVRQRLGELQADSGARGAITNLPRGEQEQAIRAMVAGLAERLSQGGGDAQEWTRLIRSQMVLGDKTAAFASLATARQRLASDLSAIAALEILAGELGLSETKP